MKNIILSEHGIYREMPCDKCQDNTEHHILFVSYNALKHTIVFVRSCIVCLDEQIALNQQPTGLLHIVSMDDWKEIVDNDDLEF